MNSSNINKLSKKKSFGKGANRGGILGNRVVLPEDYSPNNDEEFMNDKQLEFFRQKLTNWKLDLLDEATDTKDNLSAEGLQRPDIADRAQVESDASIQLRTRDRERKLISKIDAALRSLSSTTKVTWSHSPDRIASDSLLACQPLKFDLKTQSTSMVELESLPTSKITSWSCFSGSRTSS